ncbi:MAG TPA: DUF1656 domain-containing protein [Hyphomicrobium sp.]|jgi:hypothetical protein|nr:DUF1656 domain-containing protein [Hyphomicrobium sp.]
MVEEVQIFGVYAPAALAWAILAAFLAYYLRFFVHRLPLQRFNWHPGLLDIALFAVLWWGIAMLADAHILPTEFPLQ